MPVGQYQPGDTFTDKGFTSTSAFPKRAGAFADVSGGRAGHEYPPVFLTIQTPKGTPAIWGEALDTGKSCSTRRELRHPIPRTDHLAPSGRP